MTTSAHDSHAHGKSHALIYIGVWIALVCGTILTFTVAHGPRTGWTLPIALLIATTKATLVVFFFMHLKGDRGMPKVIMLTIALTLVWFISIVITDYRTRFPLGAPHGAEVQVPER